MKIKIFLLLFLFSMVLGTGCSNESRKKIAKKVLNHKVEETPKLTVLKKEPVVVKQKKTTLKKVVDSIEAERIKPHKSRKSQRLKDVDCPDNNQGILLAKPEKTGKELSSKRAIQGLEAIQLKPAGLCEGLNAIKSLESQAKDTSFVVLEPAENTFGVNDKVFVRLDEEEGWIISLKDYSDPDSDQVTYLATPLYGSMLAE